MAIALLELFVERAVKRLGESTTPVRTRFLVMTVPTERSDRMSP